MTNKEKRELQGGMCLITGIFSLLYYYGLISFSISSLIYGMILRYFIGAMRNEND